MTQRMNYYEIAPDAMKIMMEMEKYTKKVVLRESFVSLLKLELLKLMAVPIASTCTLLMRRKWERLNSAYTALALGENVLFIQMLKK